MSDLARYVMIGGFLGAGKTTAVGALARRLRDRGLRVGLITNDQSQGLVDTAVLRGQGFAVEEITGGCFCCRFDSLREAAAGLDATTRPDVFVAEPVGSCTDLVATVSYPLRRLYGDRFRVAPLSVLVDPERLGRILGLLPGRAFAPKVVYVYDKQLEEADLLVINKVDAVPTALVDQLVAALGARFPGKPVLRVSAATGEGLDAWFDRLLAEEAPVRPTMALDYVTYAEGEAELGWLNATVRLAAPAPVDADALLRALVGEVRRRVVDAGGTIAHLKATLDPGSPLGELAVVGTVDDEAQLTTRERLAEPVDGGAVLVNLRAEAAPEALEAALRAALEDVADGVTLRLEHLEAFRPAPPRPTHRDGAAA